MKTSKQHSGSPTSVWSRYLLWSLFHGLF